MDDEDCPWMDHHNYWKYFGELLYKANSFQEYVLLATVNGYVDPDLTRRYDMSIPLYCRYQPYEEFLYEYACSWNGTGQMNEKARKFRDEMLELEVENEEREKLEITI